MIFVFLGPPGAGKGTQSRLLAADLDLKIIEVGAYLRAKRQENDELGRLIKNLIDRGENVPGSVLMEVIGPDLLNYYQKPGVIVDNFLRQKDQVESWLRFSQKHSLKIDVIIHLKASLSVCWQRIQLRNQKEHRQDDSYQIFLKRYNQVYQEHIDEVLSAFKGNTPILEVNAQPPIEEVYQDIVKQLKGLGLWTKK